MQDREYTLALGAASYLLARKIASATKDEKRAGKMRRVAYKKREHLKAQFDGEFAGLAPSGLLKKIAADWDDSERLTFLIDLAFSDPFVPYAIDFKPRDLHAALRKIVPLVGLPAGTVDDIERTRDEAAGAHRHRDWMRIGLFGLGGAALLGGVGWLAAPVLGTMLAAAGLTGAAATASGLALLGGGSLAAGGFGMAGGMWLVTGVGAAVGLAGGSGSTLLYQLGAAQARAELIKLQVTFRLVVLGTQADTAKAQRVVADLSERERELRIALEEERELNEGNARRVKDVEQALQAVLDSVEWMKSEVAEGEADAA